MIFRIARAVFFIGLAMVIGGLSAYPCCAQVDPLNAGLGSFEESSDEPVTASAEFHSYDGVPFGRIAVVVEMAEPWHIYSVTQPPGGPVKTVVKLAGDAGVRLLGDFQPESPPEIVEQDPAFGIRVEQHSHHVTFSAPIAWAPGGDPKTFQLEVSFRFQACNESGCLAPTTKKLTAKYGGSVPKPADFVEPESGQEVVPAPSNPASEPPSELEKPSESSSHSTTLSPEEVAALAKRYDAKAPIYYQTLKNTSGATTFWPALLGIFIGGILLNLMPCVFPVLGLKVLGFVELGGSDPRRVALHGLAFTFGIVVSMWILAGAILALKFSLGREVNWGQQMGNPYFVGAIVILMFVLGLNLAGVFEMGLFMTRFGGAGKKKHGYLGSFLSGVLTTFVATPCSGPFLGAAMSYTLGQEAIIAMLLFTVFALGIALPYLGLSFFPKLIQALPRPGAWMETFKQLMSFALFATAAFFLRSFAKQTGIDGVSWLAMALCVMALAFYCLGHWGLPHIAAGKRYFWGGGVPLLLGGISIWMYLDAAKFRPAETVAEQIGGLNWEKWYPGLVEQRVSEKRVVWVDYTADW